MKVALLKPPIGGILGLAMLAFVTSIVGAGLFISSISKRSLLGTSS